MFNESDIARIEFVSSIISDASEILQRYATARDALCDIEGKNALLMILLQIGEKLNKIKDENLSSLLPIKNTYYIRNRITHDYDGLDLELIESIIEIELPKLKSKLDEIIKISKERN